MKNKKFFVIIITIVMILNFIFCHNIGVCATGNTVSVLGDVNCDGKLDILDFVILKNAILGIDLSENFNTDISGDEKTTAIDLMCIKRLLISGKENLNTYKVTFLGENCEIIKEEYVLCGFSVTAPQPIEKEGYEFIGWSEEFDCITKDTVIYARYNSIVDTEVLANARTVDNLTELKQSFDDGVSVIVLNKNCVLTLSNQLTVPADTTIMGNGATIKRADGYEDILIWLDVNCRLQDLKIEGNREVMVNPYWDHTIEISTRANCVIDNVTINNGNEAIVCYQDDVVVKNCNINNCGGNAIHFSGAMRTRVENCTVIGSNKKQGMGHEDGAIIWSNSCDYAICSNNYIEDSKSGFGAIDQDKNSNIKITGNTVKNCISAVDAQFTGTTDESVPSNIIITNNHFIDCGNESGIVNGVLISNANPSQKRFAENVIISNNILENTAINVGSVSGVNITNNIITNGYIKANYSPESIITGNKVEGNSIGISLTSSKKSIISNNNIRATTNCIHISGSSFSNINGNYCAQRFANISGEIIKNNNSNGLTIQNNQLFVYSGQGLLATNSDIVTNNRIDCADSEVVAIRVWGGVKGVIIENNLSNGKFAINSSTEGVIANNLKLYVTEFINVSFSLTNATADGIKKVLYGDDYNCVLSPVSGEKLPETITVTMGAKKLYADINYTYDKYTGLLVVPCITDTLNISF